MNMIEPTCLDCTERSVNCHSTCSKYLRAKEKHDKDKMLERKFKDIDNMCMGVRHDSIRRAFKCKHGYNMPV